MNSEIAIVGVFPGSYNTSVLPRKINKGSRLFGRLF